METKGAVLVKMALLGATGFVGAAVLDEALNRGHDVTAVVRHLDKLPNRARLTPAAGDVYDARALSAILMGHEALITAFNPGWKNPHLYDDQVRGTIAIIAAVKQGGLKRVLWVGGAGGLEIRPGIRVIDDPAFPESIKPGALATLNALEQLRKEPTLEWSYLAPSAALQSGQRTAHFRLGGDQLLVDSAGKSSISVQDFAMAMIDELERPTHLRQRFTVGY